MGNKKFKMLVTPFMLIQIFSKRMLVDWPKCGSDPQDEGHLACLSLHALATNGHPFDLSTKHSYSIGTGH